MLDQVRYARFRFHVRPHQVTGDTKYGTRENIRGLEAMDICAYMPLFDAWNRHPDYFGPAHFTYDPKQDVYRYAQRQLRWPFRREYLAQKTEYRANAATCNACPMKPACTPGTQGRIVHRSFHAAVQERMRAYQQTSAYEQALRKRKVWVEPHFGEGKQWHGMGRFRLRRLWRVNCKAVLIASGENLKRLLQRRRWGRRPFPDGLAGAVEGFYGLSRVWMQVDGRRANRSHEHQPRPATDHIHVAA